MLEKDGKLFPLLMCGVDACGIVSTGMKQDDAAIWGVRNSLLHSNEIDSLGGFGKVWIGCNRQMDVRKDLFVVCPCWVANVDGWILGVEPRQEETTEIDGSRARYCLD